MRVYLPAAPSELTGDEFSARTAYAATAALRAALPEEDEEGWETSAYLAAADAAIKLAGDLGRRVVIAADVAARAGTGADDHPGTVQMEEPARWRVVASMHVDEDAAAADVRAAQGGDAESVDRAADHDLLWFDPSERSTVIADLLGQ